MCCHVSFDHETVVGKKMAAQSIYLVLWNPRFFYNVVQLICGHLVLIFQGVILITLICIYNDLHNSNSMQATS
jgi:hypothetical protein